jgi:hypothetical protein
MSLMFFFDILFRMFFRMMFFMGVFMGFMTFPWLFLKDGDSFEEFFSSHVFIAINNIIRSFP